MADRNDAYKEIVFNSIPVPTTQWFKGPLKDFTKDLLLSKKSRDRGIFKQETVERAIGNNSEFNRELWGFMCLETWFRVMIDN